MDERDFEMLDILNQTKNITKASELLFTTQSSLSKRINALEEELDITLMIRSRQGIVFTPAGERVLSYTSPIAQSLREMRAVLHANKDSVSGTLRAGICPGYSFHHLPDVLARYRSDYPKVHTIIATDKSHSLYQQLIDSKQDLIIVRGEFPWNGKRVLLHQERMCIARSYKDKDRDLSELSFISRKADSLLEREVAQWFSDHNLNINMSDIVVNDVGTCLEMIKRGLGWSIVPELSLYNFEGSICEMHFSDGSAFIRNTYALYTNASALLPQVTAFLDVIQSHKMI